MTKSEQRKICINNRKNLSIFNRKDYSKIICEKIATIINSNSNVLSYIPTIDEVNTEAVNKQFKVFYPVIYKDRNMDAYRPIKDKFLYNRFKILEPNPLHSQFCKSTDLQYAIVPMVGFDENCNRMGRGKGYYDRYLSSCPDTIKIGVAFECQKLEEVLTDEHDIKMDYIITETNIYQK